MIHRKKWIRLSLLLFICSLPFSLLGENNSTNNYSPKEKEDPQEVFLSFNYHNLFNKVIIALYDDGQFYLPVSEVFSSLQIPVKVNPSPPTISGSYLNAGNTYLFDFSKYSVQLDNKKTYTFDASQMLVKELDFYVSTKVLSEVFDLHFTIDFNNLLLQLDTPHKMPVLAEFERTKERNHQKKYILQRNHYPLRYGRNRKTLAGGFLDYSLTANMNQDVNLYSYNLNLGTEVLGGDLQGSAYGSLSNYTNNFTTHDLRWRYAWRNNNNISQLFIGQTNSDGLDSRSFVGIRATNEPIEPRYIYDEFELNGNVIPGSEVELYVNNALYAYQKTTENGRYRFAAPLTYGSSNLNLKIYDPAGGVTERSRRIQIPYSFIPSGELIYHLNAGQLENPIFGSINRSNLLQGDMGYGLTNWLTQKIGIEYLDQFTTQTPLVYSSTSARLFKEYLISLDAAPTAFYRISSNVVYPSSASWDMEYTHFTGDGIYNILGYDHEISGNLYLPFTISDIPFNLRFLGDRSTRANYSRTRYSVDLNTRLDRLNLRMSYSDYQTGDFLLTPSISSEFSSSVTYFIARKRGIPAYLQDTFLRGQLSYNPNLSQIVQTDFQISKSIFSNGRIQASFSRNFRADFNLLSLGLTIDFKGVRTSSTLRSSQNGAAFTQNVLGSIGFDQHNEDITFMNRQQVGKAATSIRLYIDNNNDGQFNDGDKPIKDNAVRIGRSGVTDIDDEGVIHVSQLQSYNRINVEINKSAIKNPLLVPKIEKFSLVTDPNQYKPIDIPFYMSGVISGKVDKKNNAQTKPLPGLKLYLANKDSSFYKELRTFNDGSFYAYEVPPGQYILYVDQNQLAFLNAKSQPDTIQVKVKPMAEGDFVENLNFVITADNAPVQTDSTAVTSADSTAPKPNSDSTATAIDNNTTEKDKRQYQLQIASFKYHKTATHAVQSAEKQFDQPFRIIFNPACNLYAVRSMTIQDLNKAMDQLLRVQNSQFNLPAIVVLNAEQKEYGRIPSENSVDNRKDSLYKVQTKPRSTKEENEIRLSSNRKKSQLQDAFKHTYSDTSTKALYFDFQIQIEGINEKSRQTYLKQIADYSNVISDAAKDNIIKNDPIIFSNIPTWSETVRLRKDLAKASSLGNPIILLLEK